MVLDPETAFPIFHAIGDPSDGNALVAKVNPHTDIHSAIVELIGETGFERANIFGMGSLIGARFEDGKSMDCPISEVLLAPGATWRGSLQLPLHCIDIQNNLFHGYIIKGAAPVLVTFELMIIEIAAYPDSESVR